MQIGEKSLPDEEDKKCACDADDPNPTPIDPEELCQKGCDYYKLRAEDYESRHTCPECETHPLPEYYLGYGLKYCEKFSNEAYEKLSPKGKAWLLKTRCDLQMKMEKALKKNHRLEMDERFTEEVFNMHSSSYLEAGLADLSPGDLWEIFRTPELNEWTKWETWTQAGKVSPPVAKGLAEKYVKPFVVPWDYLSPDPAY
jgi:hypothetical protein